ncbi:MAG: cobalt-precorrin-5B (C(1))-methyltransferase [Ferroplasma sp.]
MYIENPDRANLRYGYTTGACATAATKAALIMLFTGNRVDTIEINLPAKKTATFKVEKIEIGKNYCSAAIKKDGGDDPDVTTGLYIHARVEYNLTHDTVIKGGKGVGTVTQEGLPVKPGNPAINPVPLRMIKNAASEVIERYMPGSGITVTIYVPGGEEIAKKTCNPKLGIVGGISILGTRGIVIPFSDSSWKASIVLGIRVAAKLGYDTLVYSTGGRSDGAVKQLYPEYNEQQFIEVGDFMGFSIKRALDAGIKKLIIAGMPGKMSKLAANNMDLHSSQSSIDFKFLSGIAAQLGYGNDIIYRIERANTVMQVMEILNGDSRFLDKIIDSIIFNINKITDNKIKIKIEIIKNYY